MEEPLCPLSIPPLLFLLFILHAPARRALIAPSSRSPLLLLLMLLLLPLLLPLLLLLQLLPSPSTSRKIATTCQLSVYIM